MSMRVLHAVFSNRIAGSERYCIDLANRQAEAGYEVHVAGRAGSPVAAELDERVHFHGLRLPFLRGFQLGRLVQRHGIEVCHGHLSAACKALAGLGDRCATVATLHVGYKPHQHGRLDALVCVNHAQRTRLSEYRGLARVIPNWLPEQAPRAVGDGLRGELGLAADTWVIGTVGRLHRSKGMDVLVEAFLAAAPAEAALVLVGDGPQRQELVRLAQGDPRIKFAGYRADVPACLQSFDLFVSPSREESFGLAIVEAMSASLPMIATAADGPAEFLRPHPVPLVPPGSVAALSDALRAAAAARAAGQLGKVAYDLRAFAAAERVASIGELYHHALKSKTQLQARRARGAAVAT